MSVFVRRPVATSLVSLGVVLAGIACFLRLPIDAMPSTDVPSFSITTADPGANPQTIAASVASPLEQQFARIAGVTEMISSNVAGVSTIAVQFELARDSASAMTDLIAAVDAARAQLPQDLPTEPVITRDNPADPPIMILAVQSATMPITAVDDAVENEVVSRLAAVPGVGEIGVLGRQKPAIRVEIDPLLLASLHLTFEDVRAAIAAATANRPKGTIETASRRMSVLANDQIGNAGGYGAVIVAWRNGAPVRIHDLGRAGVGPEDREIAGWQYAGGHLARGIQLVISKAPGANAAATVERIRSVLPQVEAALPRAIHIRTIADKTVNVRASLDDVERTLLVAIALVVAVVLVFLRDVRVTLIASLAVPVSLAATFAGMWLSGLGLDNLSLMGLTLAVGFVIDDAIVMLENIYRHVEHGRPPREAALAGAREMGFTIVSITVSLVAVFLPVLAMAGVTGQLFRAFAVTVAIAVVASAAVSLTLTPSLAARHLVAGRGADEAGTPGLLIGAHGAVLDFALRHRRATLLAFLATIAVTIVLFVEIPKGFLPTEDTGFMTATMEAGEDLPFARLAVLQREVDAIVAGDPAIASFASVIGSGSTGQPSNIGPALDLSETRAAARRDGNRDGAAAEEGVGPGRRVAVSSTGPGHQRRRPCRQGDVSIHAAGRGCGRARCLGAAAAAGHAASARTDRCRLGPGCDGRNRELADRSGPCGSFRCFGTGDRRRTRRCVRASARWRSILLAGARISSFSRLGRRGWRPARGLPSSMCGAALERRCRSTSSLASILGLWRRLPKAIRASCRR